MENERIKKLHEFLKEDSNDPFTLYALATEYKKNDLKQALMYFEKLLLEHENYIGTYYHAAALYEQLNEDEKAKTTYQKGMQKARELNNLHAFSELQGAYNKFMGLDYEDEV